MPSLTPSCPASTLIAGPDPVGPTSICGVLVLDRGKEEQHPDQEREESVTFTSRDGAVLEHSCCDRYIECGIWRADKGRIAREEYRLEPDAERAERDEIDTLRRLGLDDEAQVAQEMRRARLMEGPRS